MTETQRLHRHRILERKPRVEILDVRNPAVPWRTFPVHVNHPRLTRFGVDVDR